MANRREFLQAGAAASIATGIVLTAQTAHAGMGPAAAGAAAASMPLYKAVYDRRFSESRDFASESERAGVPVHAIEHDITQLWLRELLPRWREERVAVSGLTAECSYQALKWLAWDLGVRPIYYGEHLFQDNGFIRHTLTAAPAHLNRAADFEAGAQQWGIQTARLVARCPVGDTAPTRTHRIVTADGQATASRELEEVLISWVLAPVARKTGPYG